MSNTINTQNNNNVLLENSYNSTGTAYNPSLQDSQLFLKMLTMSMTNQDPTNPTDSNEFTNQMLQYTTMETLTNVTSAVKDLVSISQTNNMYNVINNAVNLVGKNVTMLIPKGTDDSTEDKYASGVAEKVTLDDKGIWVEIDGKKYEYDNLVSVNKN